MSINLGPHIPTNGLVFSTDPNSGRSWDGTTLVNLSHVNDSTTATGTVNFSTDGGGTFTFSENGSNFSFGTSGPLWGLLDVSLVGWVKQGATGSPHQTVICTSTGYLYGMKLMSRYHGAAAVWIGDGGTDSYLLSSGVDITGDGLYHHLVCTRTGVTGELKIYVDGAERGSVNTYTGFLNESGSTGYGFDYHSGGYYHLGNIGQVYGYDRVLSPDEILYMYNFGKKRYGL